MSLYIQPESVEIAKKLLGCKVTSMGVHNSGAFCNCAGHPHNDDCGLGSFLKDYAADNRFIGELLHAAIIQGIEVRFGLHRNQYECAVLKFGEGHPCIHSSDVLAKALCCCLIEQINLSRSKRKRK